jgi:hypothetical protein
MEIMGKIFLISLSLLFINLEIVPFCLADGQSSYGFFDGDSDEKFWKVVDGLKKET